MKVELGLLCFHKIQVGKGKGVVQQSTYNPI